jgi:amino acid adenylation domain-containing protein
MSGQVKDSLPVAGTSVSALSKQQQRLWVLDQVEYAAAAHNISLCLGLRGKLDAPVLERSFRALVERNPVLGARFVAIDGEPSSVRPAPADVPFSRVDVDLTHLPESQRYDTALGSAKEQLAQPFDLSKDCLLRAALFSVGLEDHLLAIAAHQIICDARSTDLLVGELAAIYAAFVTGKPAPAARPAYAEYIRRQQDYLASSRFEADLAFWKSQMNGVGAGLELPADRPRPAVQTFRGAQKTFAIEDDLLASLKELCREQRTTLFTTLLSGFVAVLYRYSGVEDLICGTEVSDLDVDGARGFIGPASNYLVLRFDCSGDPSFLELLKRTERVLGEAGQHRELPFATLLENLRLPRDLSRNPLLQVMFSSAPSFPDLAMPGLSCERIQFENNAEAADLAVEVNEGRGDEPDGEPDKVQLRFSYSTDLFDPSTIERMMGHLQTVLRSAASDPRQRVAALPLLTDAERHQIVVTWNDTKVDYPTDVPLNHFIEDQVERTPDAIALVCESQQLTYRQLNERTNQVANHLRKLGVGPDVMVGVCAERSIEMVLALVGIVKAGGAYVPLDPEYPRERLSAMLQDANPTVVLTQAALLDRVPDEAGRIICLDRDWGEFSGESTRNPPVLVGGKNLAYAIYTSGSTGKPKGVPNTHAGIVNRLLWMQDSYKLTPGDRVLQKTPYSFDVSVWEFFWPLMTGACLVMARPGGHKDPAYLVKTIAEQEITTIHFVPSMLNIFLESEGLERCRSLRQVFASGEALSCDLQQRFFERLTAELHNLYGPTEAAVDVTYWACRPNGEQTSVPIGRPVANTQIYILDRHLQPVPQGIPGELHIGGIQLARGYLNRPDLTAQKFIPDPFGKNPEDRLYKTGDLARFLAGGQIEYLGRIDHQVKLRGFRIELGEIEAVLEEHPQVRQAVVTVREDGPGDKYLAAYLAPVSDGEVDVASVRGHVEQKLPAFMVPSRFVILDAFPMTTSGKVDRKALPAPQSEARDQSEVVAPRNELESQLVSIFQRVLKTDTVGVTDDFFELGGHSLAAARVLAEVNRITGKGIPLSALFRGATVESLAALVRREVQKKAQEEAGSQLDPVVMRIQSGTGRLPFFAIVPPGEESLGYAMLARHMGPQRTVYKIQGHAPIVRQRPYTEEEMGQLSREYIAAMRSVQPEGPYSLGGMCDGTHISERIVLDLEAQGAEVGLFAIFDTWVVQHSQVRWLWQLDYYQRRLKELSKKGLGERLRKFKQVASNKADRLAGGAPGRTDWRQAYWPENFTPPRFRAPILLFKRPKQNFFYVNDPQMGWGRRSESGVEVHEVEFHHLEILREPHVRVFGETIVAFMERLDPQRDNQTKGFSDTLLVTTQSD